MKNEKCRRFIHIIKRTILTLNSVQIYCDFHISDCWFFEQHQELGEEKHFQLIWHDSPEFIIVKMLRLTVYLL